MGVRRKPDCEGGRSSFYCGSSAALSSPGLGAAGLQRWYSWAIHSRREPVKRVARMVKVHLDGIVTAVVKGITNVRAEAGVSTPPSRSGFRPYRIAKLSPVGMRVERSRRYGTHRSSIDRQGEQ